VLITVKMAEGTVDKTVSQDLTPLVIINAKVFRPRQLPDSRLLLHDSIASGMRRESGAISRSPTVYFRERGTGAGGDFTSRRDAVRTKSEADYSYRNAIIGSTSIARRAGM